MNKTHNQDDKMSKQFKTKNGLRRNLFQYALIGMLSIGMVSLQGCFSSGDEEVAGITGNTGAGGTGGEPAEPDVGASSDAKMVLLADNLQLLSGDSGSVRITANLKNAKNNLMVGEPVSFEPSSGSLQPLTDDQGKLVTDKLGNAVAILSSPHNPIPRTIKVTAIGGGSSSTINIKVDGTQLEVDGPANAIALNQSTDLNVKLKAGDGSVLQQEKISVASGVGISLGASEITTNSQGEATVTVTDTNGLGGDIVLSALGGSVSSIFSLKVSPDSVSFTVPDKGAELPLGADHLVKVKLLKDGSALPNQEISFSITRGTIEGTPETGDDKATTDAEGIAEINVQSDNAGGALLTASTEDEVASMDIEFVATTPAAVDLEAAPKQISLKQTSSLTATVRDATNNLVKKKKVLFNLTDITGGKLSKGEVITNSLGQASNVYTAGIQASGEDQVKVTAVVSGTTIEDTEFLTVDPQNVRIIFGTGNEMFDDPQKAQYRVPYVIQVSDDGGPVAGVDVDLSVFPTGYYKGEYRLVDKQGRYSEVVALIDPPVEFKPTKWSAKYSVAAVCPAEDINKNGNIDGNEDSNGDGMLTPPAVVSVGPSPGLSPTVSNSKVTTDANGFAYFSLYYPENFANWVEVELVAQTTQASRQSTFKLKTTPIAIASDINNIDKAPPAPNGSPFGTGASCNDIL